MQPTTHTLFDGLFEQNYSMTMQSLQIDIGTQYADNISKISSNYLQSFKQDESTMLKKWDLNINKGTNEEFTVIIHNTEW